MFASFLFAFTMGGVALLKPGARDTIALWLIGTHDQRSWSRAFCQTFDAIFGERHVSPRCFALSAVASMATVTLLWMLFDPVLDLLHLRTENAMPVWSVLALGAAINILPDYLSLWETRWLLQKFAAVRSVFGQLLVLFADALITGAIIFWGINAYLWLAGEPPVSLGRMLFVYDSYAIFFWSTFFTSIWAWLYALSVWVMRLSSGVLDRVLDVENKPGLILAWIFWATAMLVGTSAYTTINGKGAYLERLACNAFVSTCPDALRVQKDTRFAFQLLRRVCKEPPDAACFKAEYRRIGWTDEDAAASFNLACATEFKECRILSFLYRKGIGVPKNYIKAIELNVIVCNSGDLFGCHDIGYAYFDGIGVDKNLPKARGWWKFACNKGLALSCANLALTYELALNGSAKSGLVRKFQEKACKLDYFPFCDATISSDIDHLNPLFRMPGLNLVPTSG